ncbi:cell division protein [Bacteroidales bacterium]|nr:cell division protein [Bacteroidales bacterium]
MEITSHISFLLTKHECVIIPALGAFVVQDSKASCADDSGVFVPPMRSLGFNSELKHNDGLLSGSLMKERNISFEESNLLIEQFCDYFKKEIYTRGNIEIQSVGKFNYSQEKKLIFTPSSEPSSNASFYGFSNFYLSPLTQIEIPVFINTEKAKTSTNLWLQVGQKIISATASVAAVIIVFLLLSSPLTQDEIPQQYASFISQFASLEKMVLDSINKNKDTSEIAIIMPAEIYADKQALDLPAYEEKEIEVLEIFPEKIVAENSMSYCIVVGSFPSLIQAEKELANIQKEEQFKNATIINKENRARISVGQFYEKAEADDFLNNLRKSNPKYADAWLLCQ